MKLKIYEFSKSIGRMLKVATSVSLLSISPTFGGNSTFNSGMYTAICRQFIRPHSIDNDVDIENENAMFETTSVFIDELSEVVEACRVAVWDAGICGGSVCNKEKPIGVD